MKFPDRPIRTTDPHTAKYNYYDHEKVVQDDGRIAAFQITNHTRDKGWVFTGYKDKYGFSLWDDEDRKRMWDESITVEQLLIRSIKGGCTIHKARQEFGNDFELGEGEIMLEYKYGGMLSGRGGYIIVHKDNPTTILRSKATWMS